MPNHLTTVCTVTGPPEAIEAFATMHIHVVEGEDTKTILDFQTVIPAPEIVAKTLAGTQAETGFFALTGLIHSSFAVFPIQNPMVTYSQHRGFQCQPMTTPKDFARWLADHEPDTLEEGRKSLQCFRETGHRDWYEWNIANWGTKWGAYAYRERFREPGKFVFEFQTANGFPGPIFEKLTELHSALTFDVVTIDEGGPEYEWRYSATEKHFEKKEESRDRYRFVYGREPYSDDDDDEEMN